MDGEGFAGLRVVGGFGEEAGFDEGVDCGGKSAAVLLLVAEDGDVEAGGVDLGCWEVAREHQRCRQRGCLRVSDDREAVVREGGELRIELRGHAFGIRARLGGGEHRLEPLEESLGVGFGLGALRIGA